MQFKRGQDPKEAIGIGMTSHVPKIVLAVVKTIGPDGGTSTRRLTSKEAILLVKSWQDKDPEKWIKHPSEVWFTVYSPDRNGRAYREKYSAMEYAEFHQYAKIMGEFYLMPYWIEKSRLESRS
jgi:hypothetical protein